MADPLRYGDPVTPTCTPVANLLPRTLALAGGSLAKAAAGLGQMTTGKLLLASRKSSYQSTLGGQGLTVCNGDFARAGFLPRLSMRRVVARDIDGWGVAFTYQPFGIPVPLGTTGPTNVLYNAGYRAPAPGGTIRITWTGLFPGTYDEPLAGGASGGTGDGFAPPFIGVAGSGSIRATALSDGSFVFINFS